jgi:hypothetical protein
MVPHRIASGCRKRYVLEQKHVTDFGLASSYRRTGMKKRGKCLSIGTTFG